MVINFPLSQAIFKVNFPLSNDPLALVSAKRQQQRHYTGLSLKSMRLSSFIEFISHILLRVFHSSWLLMLKISTPTPEPNYNSGTLSRYQIVLDVCSRGGDKHFSCEIRSSLYFHICRKSICKFISPNDENQLN